ncbi:stromal processing peptidase, chloroplastic-like, partial [Morus notabilis]|uniref:stromal processing peptidase, chloroplastic-like n=1 Tax=Morus notabilis TaxID=981085 RepID=UPI000CED43CE
VQRLKELGISYDEFTLHKDVILNDSANFIAVLDDDSSSDIIKLIMRNDALGRATMEVREAHKVLAAVATTITLDEVNSIGAELLELVSDFGKPSAPVPTIIMACAPTTHEVKGELVGFTVNPSEIEFAMKQGLDDIIY